MLIRQRSLHFRSDWYQERGDKLEKNGLPAAHPSELDPVQPVPVRIEEGASPCVYAEFGDISAVAALLWDSKIREQATALLWDPNSRQQARGRLQ